jgi:hypothetical protein
VPRLSAADLGVLGRYLYGPRWQAQLARELGVSRQLVVYWVGGKRPVSELQSRRIAMAARRRHDERVLRERAHYVEMCQGLASSSARALMLSMIANEIEARLGVIRAITGLIEGGLSKLAGIARDGVLADHPKSDGHDPHALPSDTLAGSFRLTDAGEATRSGPALAESVPVPG